MIRGIVKSVVQGVIQRVSATVWGDGSIDNRELIQHYGYTSRPKEGAEVIFIRQGGQIIAIGSDDRRYRISLEDGEVALYTDEGDKIHLKRNNEIHIKTGNRMFVESTGSCDIFVTGKTTVKSDGTIELDGGTGDVGGVVQNQCICPFIKAPHIMVSTNVKASL